MADLAQRVTLVTGSTKGIGRAIAAAFVAQGAHVVLHGRDPEEVARIREEIGAKAGVTGDLATASGCREVLDQLAGLDPVEILVHGAAQFAQHHLGASLATKIRLLPHVRDAFDQYASVGTRRRRRGDGIEHQADQEAEEPETGILEAHASCQTSL